MIQENKPQRKPSQASSEGAHNTHRPLAFPLTARSTMLGCEHVTACTAVILAKSSAIAPSKGTANARPKGVAATFDKSNAHFVLSSSRANKSPFAENISSEWCMFPTVKWG